MVEQIPDSGNSTTSSFVNRSGQGPIAALPRELEGWNWGAFFLTWIWGVGNMVWWSLLALVPVQFARLAVGILLGIKGNEWAWQSKRWNSIEHFRRTQHVWAIWGFISLLLPIVLIIGLILIMVGVLGYAGMIKFCLL